MKKRIYVFLLCAWIILTGINAEVYYINSESGNDQNSGINTEAAWATLLKVNSMVFSPGDSILFLRGGKWMGMLAPKGSGTTTEPVVFAAYGEGDESPLIHANGNNQAVILKNLAHITFCGFRITNPAVAPNRKARGIYIFADQPKVYRNITIRDNEIHNIIGWVRQDRRFSSGAIFTDTQGAEARFEGLLIENNYIHDVTTRGITGNAGALNWQDTAYHHRNILIRGNTIDNTGCDAIRPIASSNVTIEHNKIYRTGKYTMGEEALYIAACFPQQCGNTTWQFNEVAYTAPTNPSAGDMDSQAFDVDHGCTGTHVFQYNYTHDNFGGFFLVMGSIIVDEKLGAPEGVIIRYNISQNDGPAIGRLFELHDFKEKFLNIQVYNNDFYYTTGTMGIQAKGSSFNLIKFSNNVFYAPSGDYPGSVNLTNNLYYPHSPPGQDIWAVSGDPLFADPGRGGEYFDSLEGYKLLPGSPAIGSGAMMANNGGRDFWGSPVINSYPIDIGAHQTGTAQAYGAVNSVREHRELAYPNPCSDLVRIRHKMNSQSIIRSRIISATGSIIFEYPEQLCPPGEFEFIWDGTTTSGVPAGSGLYFLLVESGSERTFVRISLIR